MGNLLGRRKKEVTEELEGLSAQMKLFRTDIETTFKRRKSVLWHLTLVIFFLTTAVTSYVVYQFSKREHQVIIKQKLIGPCLVLLVSFNFVVGSVEPCSFVPVPLNQNSMNLFQFPDRLQSGHHRHGRLRADPDATPRQHVLRLPRHEEAAKLGRDSGEEKEDSRGRQGERDVQEGQGNTGEVRRRGEGGAAVAVAARDACPGEGRPEHRNADPGSRHWDCS